MMLYGKLSKLFMMSNNMMDSNNNNNNWISDNSRNNYNLNSPFKTGRYNIYNWRRRSSRKAWRFLLFNPLFILPSFLIREEKGGKEWPKSWSKGIPYQVSVVWKRWSKNMLCQYVSFKFTLKLGFISFWWYILHSYSMYIKSIISCSTIFSFYFNKNPICVC